MNHAKFEDFEVYVDKCINDVHCEREAHLQTVTLAPLDLERLRPNFGWVPIQRIEDTIENTTQYYHATITSPFRVHHKTHFPGANVNRLIGWWATDTWFSDMPALDDGIKGHGGATMMQIYVSKDTDYAAGYPMSHENQMPHTFESLI